MGARSGPPPRPPHRCSHPPHWSRCRVHCSSWGRCHRHLGGKGKTAEVQQAKSTSSLQQVNNARHGSRMRCAAPALESTPHTLSQVEQRVLRVATKQRDDLTLTHASTRSQSEKNSLCWQNCPSQPRSHWQVGPSALTPTLAAVMPPAGEAPPTRLTAGAAALSVLLCAPRLS